MLSLARSLTRSLAFSRPLSRGFQQANRQLPTPASVRRRHLSVFPSSSPSASRFGAPMVAQRPRAELASASYRSHTLVQSISLPALRYRFAACRGGGPQRSSPSRSLSLIQQSTSDNATLNLEQDLSFFARVVCVCMRIKLTPPSTCDPCRSRRWSPEGAPLSIVAAARSQRCAQTIRIVLAISHYRYSRAHTKCEGVRAS